jgi:FMN phosphatase YigB (HAD superfamily)
MVSEHLKATRCILFDFAGTLCASKYFDTQPPPCPDWLETIDAEVFSESRALLESWMSGTIALKDVAGRLCSKLRLPLSDVIAGMRAGCCALQINDKLMGFARDQRRAGKKVGIVTVNMDVFTEVVVPFHHLDEEFDVIVNSADHHETDKVRLCEIAFRRLGAGFGFSSSVLIDDKPSNVASFEGRGGVGHVYQGEQCFFDWLGRA